MFLKALHKLAGRKGATRAKNPPADKEIRPNTSLLQENLSNLKGSSGEASDLLAMEFHLGAGGGLRIAIVYPETLADERRYRR